MVNYILGTEMLHNNEIRHTMNKFHAKPVWYNGKLYASTKEANYCRQLDILKRATGNDRVIKYETQVRYNVEINGVFIGFYKLDFKVYYPDRIEYIDVKGYKKGTIYQFFRWKKKLVQAIYGIIILEK